LETNVLLFYSDNKEHNSNQLTVINAHVGYVLFTVVMTTFTVAPSSGVPYADALFDWQAQESYRGRRGKLLTLSLSNVLGKQDQIVCKILLSRIVYLY